MYLQAGLNDHIPDSRLDALATDDCAGLQSLTNDYNGSGTLAGETFPNGQTVVTWTATDAEGNTETCQTVVNVGSLCDAPLGLSGSRVQINPDDALTLKKTGGSNWHNGSGARTQTSLASGADGSISITLGSNPHYCFYGLATGLPTGTSSMPYAWYVVGNGNTSGARVELREGSSIVQTFSYTVGDVLKIERVGSEIRYFINNTLVRTKPSANTGALYAA